MLLPFREEEFRLLEEGPPLSALGQLHVLSTDLLLYVDTAFKYACFSIKTRELVFHGRVETGTGESPGPIPAYTPWIGLAADGETLGFVGTQAKKVFHYNLPKKSMTFGVPLQTASSQHAQAGFTRFDPADGSSLSVYFSGQDTVSLVVVSNSGTITTMGSFVTPEGQLMLSGDGKPFWLFCFQSPSSNAPRIFFANTKVHGAISMPWSGIPCGLLYSSLPASQGQIPSTGVLCLFFNQTKGSKTPAPGMLALQLDFSRALSVGFANGGTVDHQECKEIKICDPEAANKPPKLLLPDLVMDEVFREAYIRTYDHKLCRIKLFNKDLVLEPKFHNFNTVEPSRGYRSAVDSKQQQLVQFQLQPDSKCLKVKRIAPLQVKPFYFWLLSRAVPGLRVDNRPAVVDLLVDSLVQ